MLLKTDEGYECLHCLLVHKPRYRLVDGVYVETEPSCDHPFTDPDWSALRDDE